MAEPEQPKRPKVAATYQAAVEAVMSVVVAMGIGFWADSYFESSPIGLLTGAAVGFASMVLRLVRLGRVLNPDTEAAGDPDERSDEPKG